jgi:hypothetical protein
LRRTFEERTVLVTNSQGSELQMVIKKLRMIKKGQWPSLYWRSSVQLLALILTSAKKDRTAVSN